MTTDTHAVTKLATDVSNWVIYSDRMTLHFKSRHWASHLTSTTIPQAYIAKGDVNGLTPDERWALSMLKRNKYIGILSIAVTTLQYITISMITIFSMYIAHVH